MRNYGLFVGSMMIVCLLFGGCEVVFGQDASYNEINDVVVRVAHIQKTTGDDVISTIDTSGGVWKFQVKKGHNLITDDILIIKVSNGRIIGANIN